MGRSIIINTNGVTLHLWTVFHLLLAREIQKAARTISHHNHYTHPHVIRHAIICVISRREIKGTVSAVTTLGLVEKLSELVLYREHHQITLQLGALCPRVS